MKPIRVVVVDDSTFIRKALARMLGDHERIDFVGDAGSGEELLANLETWQPDVITMDLDMPGMGGLETLNRLTAIRPTPVIVLSTHTGEGAPLTIEALHRGGTDFIDKQRYSLVDFETLRGVLLEKIFQVTGASADDEIDEALPTPDDARAADLAAADASRYDTPGLLAR
ncbi:MAG: response regulator, partial [Acidobacteriota bacterium]